MKAVPPSVPPHRPCTGEALSRPLGHTHRSQRGSQGPLDLGVPATLPQAAGPTHAATRGPKSWQLQRKSKRISLAKRTKGGAFPCPPPPPPPFLHHADVNTALQPAGLAVAAVVLGDAAVSIEGTGEQRLPLHAPPAEREQGPSAGSPTSQPLSPACVREPVTVRPAGQAPGSKTPRENGHPAKPLAPLRGHPCPTL